MKRLFATTRAKTGNPPFIASPTMPCTCASWRFTTAHPQCALVGIPFCQTFCIFLMSRIHHATARLFFVGFLAHGVRYCTKYGICHWCAHRDIFAPLSRKYVQKKLRAPIRIFVSCRETQVINSSIRLILKLNPEIGLCVLSTGRNHAECIPAPFGEIASLLPDFRILHVWFPQYLSFPIRDEWDC